MLRLVHPDRKPVAQWAEAVYRNPDLLAAVRKLECVSCAREKHTQAAHSNQARFGKGRNHKSSDAAIMALCTVNLSTSKPGCHEKLDQGKDMSKEERRAFEYEHIAMTLIALIERGYLVVDKARLEK